jgi:hypothetical protein
VKTLSVGLLSVHVETWATALVGNQYDLPKGTEGIDPAADGVSSPAAGINMASSEVLLSPIGSVPVK